MHGFQGIRTSSFSDARMVLFRYTVSKNNVNSNISLDRLQNIRKWQYFFRRSAKDGEITRK